MTVYGSLKNQTLNLEKIKIQSLVPAVRQANPACPVCGKRMESAGRGQGFRCRSCRTTAAEKTAVPVPRMLKPGFYEVPPSARRHLSKPLIRCSKEELEK